MFERARFVSSTHSLGFSHYNGSSEFAPYLLMGLSAMYSRER